MLPQDLNYVPHQQENQKRRNYCLSKVEVILILGEPNIGDLSALWKVDSPNPWTSHGHQRRLLIFTSDIHGLPEPTASLAIHVLPFRPTTFESSGFSSHTSHGGDGGADAIYLAKILQKASQFAARWRADEQWSFHNNKVTSMGGSSNYDSAHSSQMLDSTHHIDNRYPTRSILKNINTSIIQQRRDGQLTQSKPNSKATATTAQDLPPKFLNFTSTSLLKSSAFIHRSRSGTSRRVQSQPQDQNFHSYGGTFDAILNFLPQNSTEKHLLKQAILISTLCRQYLVQSEPERSNLAPNQRISSRIPSSLKSLRFQNENDKENIASRTQVDSEIDEARRTSTASSGYSSASAATTTSSARSVTPNGASISTKEKRWSVFSWLSTTSASQASDPEPEVSKDDDRIASSLSVANKRESTDVSFRPSELLRRSSKGPQSSKSSPRGELIMDNGERGSAKVASISRVPKAPHKPAYLIHLLPRTWLSPSSLKRDSSLSHAVLCQDNTRPEQLEKTVTTVTNSDQVLPLSQAITVDTGTTQSFTHARIQKSLMRRATVQQMQSRNFEKTNPTLPSDSSRTKSTPTLGVSNSAACSVMLKKRGHYQQLADRIEAFLNDYFDQGLNGSEGLLPIVLDVDVFGSEVSVLRKGEPKRRILVGEAVLCGFLDTMELNGRRWIAKEDLGDILSLDEHREEPARIPGFLGEASELASDSTQSGGASTMPALSLKLPVPAHIRGSFTACMKQASLC